MADREILPQKSSAMPFPAIDGNVDSVSDSNGYGILSPLWTERLAVLKKTKGFNLTILSFVCPLLLRYWT